MSESEGALGVLASTDRWNVTADLLEDILVDRLIFLAVVLHIRASGNRCRCCCWRGNFDDDTEKAEWLKLVGLEGARDEHVEVVLNRKGPSSGVRLRTKSVASHVVVDGEDTELGCSCRGRR